MSFLSPKFTNDIFLSYARVDNTFAKPKRQGWVDSFKKSLEVELLQLHGRKTITIWMNTRELESNDYFDDELKDQIRQSGIFLALTSHGYLNEEAYCRKELKEFYDHAKESLRLGNRSRIFNCLLYNISYDNENWPSEYSGTTAAEFFDTSEADEGYPSRHPRLGRQIRKLAREIYSFLEEYKETFTSPQRAPAPPPPPPPARAKVFLADTVESLKTDRDCLVARLEREGIQVFDRIPPPYETHDQEVVQRMTEADLSVHLFGDTQGEKFINGGKGETFLQRQVELGFEHAKSQFVWVPPKALVDIPTIKDDGYRGFLQSLESAERDKKRYTFRRDASNVLAEEILSRIKELSNPEPERHSLTALLATHIKDQAHALDLYDLLLEKGLDPRINRENDDPGEKIGAFEKLARQVSVLIVIFGMVASEWVSERIITALQVAGTQDPQRLQLCGIYVPPDDGSAPRELSLKLQGSNPIIYFPNLPTLAACLDGLKLGGDK